MRNSVHIWVRLVLLVIVAVLAVVLLTITGCKTSKHSAVRARIAAVLNDSAAHAWHRDSSGVVRISTLEVQGVPEEQLEVELPKVADTLLELKGSRTKLNIYAKGGKLRIRCTADSLMQVISRMQVDSVRAVQRGAASRQVTSAAVEEKTDIKVVKSAPSWWYWVAVVVGLAVGLFIGYNLRKVLC